MNTQDGAERLVVLEKEVEQLRAEVVELNSSVRALVEAWNTATGVVKFVKFLSTFIAGVAAIWLFVRHGLVPKGE